MTTSSSSPKPLKLITAGDRSKAGRDKESNLAMNEKTESCDGAPDASEKTVESSDRKPESRDTDRGCEDPGLVSWNGPSDTANPKNWTKTVKWTTTVLVSLFTFLSPLSGTMISPALGAIASDLHIADEFESQLCLSIFLLGLGFAPLILSPLSEIYGRVPVLLLGNSFYLAWNTGCGFARSSGQMLAFRFLSGLGASAPLAVGAGLVSDLWDSDGRGRAVAVYSVLPLLGPAVGPIAGGWISQDITWRWIFWASSVAGSLFQVITICLLRETYAPKLLRNKVKRLEEAQTGMDLHTEYEDAEQSLGRKLSINLIRPLRLLGTQPIIQFLALYMAYLYGIMFLVLSTFPVLWSKTYNESVGIGDLNFISLGLGYIIGSQLSGFLNDVFFRRLKERNSGISRPEFRVPLMIPGSLMVPTGMLIYGWTGQAHTHWIVPNIGATLFAAGIILCFQSIQTYTIDGYARYAASAVAALNLARSLTGFAFPAYAPYMYSALGFGWGNSLLAFIAITLGSVLPLCLWRYGAFLRAKSTYAAGD